MVVGQAETERTIGATQGGPTTDPSQQAPFSAAVGSDSSRSETATAMDQESQEPLQSSPEAPFRNPSVIAAVSAAAVVILILTALLLWCYRRNRRSKQASDLKSSHTGTHGGMSGVAMTQKQSQQAATAPQGSNHTVNSRQDGDRSTSEHCSIPVTGYDASWRFTVDKYLKVLRSGCIFIGSFQTLHSTPPSTRPACKGLVLNIPCIRVNDAAAVVLMLEIFTDSVAYLKALQESATIATQMGVPTNVVCSAEEQRTRPTVVARRGSKIEIDYWIIVQKRDTLKDAIRFKRLSLYSLRQLCLDVCKQLMKVEEAGFVIRNVSVESVRQIGTQAGMPTFAICDVKYRYRAGEEAPLPDHDASIVTEHMHAHYEHANAGCQGDVLLKAAFEEHVFQVAALVGQLITGQAVGDWCADGHMSWNNIIDAVTQGHPLPWEKTLKPQIIDKLGPHCNLFLKALHRNPANRPKLVVFNQLFFDQVQQLQINDPPPPQQISTINAVNTTVSATRSASGGPSSSASLASTSMHDSSSMHDGHCMHGGASMHGSSPPQSQEWSVTLALARPEASDSSNNSNTRLGLSSNKRREADIQAHEPHAYAASVKAQRSAVLASESHARQSPACAGTANLSTNNTFPRSPYEGITDQPASTGSEVPSSIVSAPEVVRQCLHPVIEESGELQASPTSHAYDVHAYDVMDPGAKYAGQDYVPKRKGFFSIQKSPEWGSRSPLPVELPFGHQPPDKSPPSNAQRTTTSTASDRSFHWPPSHKGNESPPAGAQVRCKPGAASGASAGESSSPRAVNTLKPSNAGPLRPKFNVPWVTEPDPVQAAIEQAEHRKIVEACKAMRSARSLELPSSSFCKEPGSSTPSKHSLEGRSACSLELPPTAAPKQPEPRGSPDLHAVPDSAAKFTERSVQHTEQDEQQPASDSQNGTCTSVSGARALIALAKDNRRAHHATTHGTTPPASPKLGASATVYEAARDTKQSTSKHKKPTSGAQRAAPHAAAPRQSLEQAQAHAELVLIQNEEEFHSQAARSSSATQRTASPSHRPVKKEQRESGAPQPAPKSAHVRTCDHFGSDGGDDFEQTEAFRNSSQMSRIVLPRRALQSMSSSGQGPDTPPSPPFRLAARRSPLQSPTRATAHPRNGGQGFRTLPAVYELGRQWPTSPRSPDACNADSSRSRPSQSSRTRPESSPESSRSRPSVHELAGQWQKRHASPDARSTDTSKVSRNGSFSHTEHRQPKVDQPTPHVQGASTREQASSVFDLGSEWQTRPSSPAARSTDSSFQVHSPKRNDSFRYTQPQRPVVATQQPKVKDQPAPPVKSPRCREEPSWDDKAFLAVSGHLQSEHPCAGEHAEGVDQPSPCLQRRISFKEGRSMEEAPEASNGITSHLKPGHPTVAAKHAESKHSDGTNAETKRSEAKHAARKHTEGKYAERTHDEAKHPEGKHSEGNIEQPSAPMQHKASEKDRSLEGKASIAIFSNLQAEHSYTVQHSYVVKQPLPYLQCPSPNEDLSSKGKSTASSPWKPQHTATAATQHNKVGQKNLPPWSTPSKEGSSSIRKGSSSKEGGLPVWSTTCPKEANSWKGKSSRASTGMSTTNTCTLSPRHDLKALSLTQDSAVSDSTCFSDGRGSIRSARVQIGHHSHRPYPQAPESQDLLCGPGEFGGGGDDSFFS